MEVVGFVPQGWILTSLLSPNASHVGWFEAIEIRLEAEGGFARYDIGYARYSAANDVMYSEVQK